MNETRYSFSTWLSYICFKQAEFSNGKKPVFFEDLKNIGSILDQSSK